MSRKNKTENSYAGIFKQKFETPATGDLNSKGGEKKGINFEDFDDWGPINNGKNQNNSNQSNKEENQIQNGNNHETTRKMKVHEIVQNFGVNYVKQSEQ